MLHLLLTIALCLFTIADDPRLHTDRTALPPDLPLEDDAFTFVVYGDRTGGDAEGIKVLRQAVVDTNLLDPDLVMTVGDLVQGYNTRPAWMLQMNEFKAVMNELHMPWFPVAGNHDIYWRGPGRPSEEHEGDYEAFFGPLWYAFDHKDCRFIVLYTDEGDPKTSRRTFNEPASQRMSEAQFSWLRTILETARTQRHVFVFMHHPRWRQGGYGDDWSKVHDILVAAGNVTAVFAGHVHQLRHDGAIDGIEYLSLATVGGHLPRDLPAGGWLDHVLQVVVRDEGITMAAVPVGGVLDPAALNPAHLAAIEALRTTAPRTGPGPSWPADQPLQGTIDVHLHNPTSKQIRVDLALVSDDPRWKLQPDHVHQDISPGETATIPLQVAHPGTLDEAWRPVRAQALSHLLDGGRAWRVPMMSIDLPIEFVLEAGAWRPGLLDIPGEGAAMVRAQAVDLPDGPLTLECWVRPRNLKGRRGLVAKTENSEFGLFVSDAKPNFSIFLGQAYVEAKAVEPLTMNQWHHVAGVFDGQEVRLYVDGHRVAATPGSGLRRRNALPLIVGGDVNAEGLPVSSIDGQVDLVRLSDSVRYRGEHFKPRNRLSRDDHAVLLLDMDGARGGFLPTRAGSAAARIIAPAKSTESDVARPST